MHHTTHTHWPITIAPRFSLSDKVIRINCVENGLSLRHLATHVYARIPFLADFHNHKFLYLQQFYQHQIICDNTCDHATHTEFRFGDSYATRYFHFHFTFPFASSFIFYCQQNSVDASIVIWMLRHALKFKIIRSINFGEKYNNNNNVQISFTKHFYYVLCNLMHRPLTLTHARTPSAA